MVFKKYGFNYLQALRPLIKALGIEAPESCVLEALPHLEMNLSLEDLQNTLCRLGYKSSISKVRLSSSKIQDKLGLFLSKEGEVYLLNSNSSPLDKADISKTHMALNLKTKKNILLSKSFKIKGLYVTFSPLTPKESEPFVIKDILKRFKPYYASCLFLSFVSAILSLCVPFYIKGVYEFVLSQNSLNTLKYLSIGAGIGFIFYATVHVLKGYTTAYLKARVQAIVSQMVFEKILFAEPSKIEGTSIGAKLSNIRQFDKLSSLFLAFFTQIVFELPFILISLGALYVLAGAVVLMPLLLGSALAFLGYHWFEDIKKASLKDFTQSYKKQSFLIDSINQYDALKQFSLEDSFLKEFKTRVLGKSKAFKEIENLKGLLGAISHLLVSIFGVFTLIGASFYVIEGTMSVSSFVAASFLGGTVFPKIQTLFITIMNVSPVKIILSQFEELLKLPQESPQKILSKKSEIRGGFNFQNVTFCYERARVPALQTVSFELSPGEFMTVQGGSGSGKTTLLKLLLGLYAPNEGYITLDNLDLCNFDKKTLRQAIATVSNTHHFFNASVAQNLRLGKPEATKEDLLKALEQAGALKGVLNLPQGVETILTKKTVALLPSGLKQRLVLTRAYLKNASIYLFDEPTASLDEEGKALFKEILLSFKGNKTVILLSQDPELINLSDKVLTLEKGLMTGFDDYKKMATKKGEAA
ncbi:MAG TPA: ATP-binding cassette domain-containing protein [Alphaproteobacteria bacterium]|nr:ATP-binding cassette domain-containing protein [Alphaproteobacteria bacterium]